MLNLLISYEERRKIVTEKFNEESERLNIELDIIWNTIRPDILADVNRIVKIPKTLIGFSIESNPFHHTCLHDNNIPLLYIEFACNDIKYYMTYNESDVNKSYTLYSDTMNITDFMYINCSKPGGVINRQQTRHFNHFIYGTDSVQNREKCSDMMLNTIDRYPNDVEAIFTTITRLSNRYLKYKIYETRKSVILILRHYKSSILNEFPRDVILMICKYAMNFE